MANMSPMMVIGLQKSGKLYDYIHLIGSSIRPNSIYCVTDDFRNNYVDFDKTPSSTTYGNETYYGQDFLLKTSSGKLFVFNAPYPFPNKDNIAVFKKEKANIEHYFNIGAYVRLIADNRNLFHLSSNGSPLQSKDHIRCALKKALVLFPAYAAFAMLQANELLLHFSAAVRADLITVSHIIQPALIYIDCGWIPRPYATTGRQHRRTSSDKPATAFPYLSRPRLHQRPQARRQDTSLYRVSWPLQ